jgi:osmoprotectant transport system ATP-binding protein
MTRPPPGPAGSTVPDPTPVLALENVSKTYGALRALSPTTLRFRRGTTTVLLGPSGCGKSTVLRMAIGLLRPDTGAVRLRGELLTRENVRQLRRAMGYVVQEGGLFPHLTAAGNVTLMARQLGWPRARLDGRVDELCALARLPPDALQRFPAQLSGGQRQRVSLMRALMLDPEVLLLDEPLGAIDPLMRADLQADLAQAFVTLGKTVVMVTHDLAEAAFFGHQLVLMRAGAVVQEGSLPELLERPADPFVTRFIAAHRALELPARPAS